MSFEPMSAADVVLCVVAVSFSLMLVPALTSRKSRLPRLTSGLTAFGLGAVAVVYASLGLPLATLGELSGVGVWLALFAWRSGP